MKWLLLLVCTLVFVPGCCGSRSTTAFDPFFGYTRVPPPPTGSLSSQSTDPYYPSGPPSMAPLYPSGPPSMTPPMLPRDAGGPNTFPPNTGTTGQAIPRVGPYSGTPIYGGSQPPAPSGGNRYAPPGGSFDYQGRSGPATGVLGGGNSATRVPPPSFAHRAGTDRSPQPVDGMPASVPGGDPVIQVLQPRPRAIPVSGSGATRQPRRMAPPTRAVDIMDLPEAGSSTTPDRAESSHHGNGFRLVSTIVSPTDSVYAADSGKVVAAVAPSTATANPTGGRSKYGHDPQYRWLRGKLEHSQIDGCWKLRYIPIDGATDDFGGSVIFSDASILTGIERGEFIEVRGKIDRSNPTKGFAPIYQATEILR